MSGTSNSTNNTDTPANDIAAAEAPKQNRSCSKATAQGCTMSGNNRVDEPPPQRLSRYRGRPGERIVLADVDPDTSEHYKKRNTSNLSISAIGREITSTLYAENQRSLLIVLQAMDTGGKDGTIKHMSFKASIPKGCRVWVIQKPVKKPVTTFYGATTSERRSAG